MATILTPKDLESFKMVAAKSAAGRKGRFAYLAGMIREMNVNDSLDITEDLSTEEFDAVSKFVTDSDKVEKSDRDKVRSVASAFIRETRKVHGEKSDAIGTYRVSPDGTPAYVVTRVK